MTLRNRVEVARGVINSNEDVADGIVLRGHRCVWPGSGPLSVRVKYRPLDFSER